MARRSGGGRGPRAPDRPRLRAQRARRRRDGRPRGRARRRGAAVGRGSSSRASRRCSSTRSRPTTCPTAPRELRLGDAAPPGRPAARAVRSRLPAGHRGCRARRVRAARRDRRRVPAVEALPIRIEFFGDEIDSLRSFDPTDQRTVGTVDAAIAAAGVGVPAARPVAAARSAIASVGPRAGSRSAWRPTSPGSTGSRSARGRARVNAAGPRPQGPSPADPGGGRRRRRGGLGAHLAPATGLDHIAPGTLLVLDEPGDIAEAAEFLWRQADERRAELVEAGELPKDWPSTYLPPRDWKGRLVASRTLELTWESEPPEDVAMARGGAVVRRPVRLARARPAAWAEPAASTRRSRAGGRTSARIVLASDQAPRLAELLGEAGHPVAVVGRVAEAPPPGRDRAHRAEPQRRLRRRPGRPGLRHRSRAVRHRPRPPAAGDAAGRPARHPRAPDARRPRRPHRPRHRALRADAPARRRRRRARLPRAGVRGRRPDLRAGRADRPDQRATRAARRPALSKLGGTRMAAHEAARPQGGRRPRRGAARAVRVAQPTRAATRSDRTRPWQAEMEASFPYEETIDQLRAAAEVKPDMEAGPADGPARRRRRRLRQDRGRAARGVQGDPGRQAGRGPRPDDRPRGPAPRDVRRSASRPSRSRSRCCRGSSRQADAGGDGRRPRRRHRSTS